MPLAIETRQLTRRFGYVTVVDDLSLNVEQGEVFSLTLALVAVLPIAARLYPRLAM